ncbi:Protein of unknown function (DUF688) [Melia azedarach]|uniref:Uncharacterized protein n=1 Tax=Melia azedarach TaxID=155640 RepID=A0ACC1WYY6_MELAZ|nr:Protein of unknown function (DUF688) [Melia azedarach]
MKPEKEKAMDKSTCPGKKLDFNARLISTKRPSGFHEEEMCSKFQDTSDRIPFCWEQAPGKPKDSDRSDNIQDCETDQTPRLRIPPGRWHPPREFTSTSDDLQFFRNLHQDDGCDADIDDDYGADNNEDIFSDAVDVLSLTEAIDIVEKAEKGHGLDGFNLESLGHDESISPSYIIERFLPDATALAASSVLSLSKNLSRKLPYNSSQACVPQAARRSYSLPKGCGLEMLFPWRMKHRICGVKSPVRQENSANFQPGDQNSARNRSRFK